jgi:hypothetical protein
MATTLYLRSGLSASANQSPAVVALPSTLLAGANWNASISTSVEANAVFLSVSAGSSQLSLNTTWPTVNIHGSHSICYAQYLSNPLAAQTISGGSWTIALAADETVSHSGGTYQRQVALFLVNGSTGAARNTIFAFNQIGTNPSTTSNGEQTAYTAAATGSSATVTAGDYLCLEVGIVVNAGSSGGFTPASDTYDSGTTAISSDGASTSNAQSLITSPGTLTFQMPSTSGPIGLALTGCGL